MARTARRPLFLVVPALLTIGVGLVDMHVFRASSRAPLAEGGQVGVTRTLQAATSTRRQGAYFLPKNYGMRAVPLMVGFHGTGGKGSLMILRLQALAEKEGFIVLAPDSVSVSGVWAVGQRSDEMTEDYKHVMDGVREVLRVPGVRVDPAHVLAAGFSVGGSMAPYIASHEEMFTAFAVLHGHITVGAMGPRRPRGWLSAGDRDRARTADYVRSAADRLRREGFEEVDLRIFRADHTLGDDELAALVAWWLRRQGHG